jgi:two-component system, NarL family, sensor histidine kinase DesK
MMTGPLAAIGNTAWPMWLGLLLGSALTATCVAVTLGTRQYFARNRTNRCLRRASAEIEELARTTERERIARDLHDVLGHSLFLIILKAELAGRTALCDARQCQAELREIADIAGNARVEVKTIITGYLSGGIMREIARAEHVLSIAGIATELNTEPVGLTPTQETVLALAMREGVTNIVQHAQAHHCKLILRREDGAAVLEIRDDGCGCSELEGNGLRGMRQRVMAMGGTMSRDNHQGTRLAIRLPLSRR